MNQDQKSLNFNSLSGAQKDHQIILKHQTETLFVKLTQLEDKLKNKLINKKIDLQAFYNIVNILSLYFMVEQMLD